MRDINLVFFYIILWAALFRERTDIAGYSLRSIITYYVLAKIIDQIYSYEPARIMTRDILTGSFSAYLVKPLRYFPFLAAVTVGRRLARVSLTIILTIFAFVFLPKFFVIPSSALIIFVFSISSILSWLLVYEIVFFFGILSFWISETSGLRSAFEQMVLVLGGLWVPLDLLPEQVQKIFTLLPFQYLYYHLIQIYQGRINPRMFLQGIMIQLIWITIFAVAIKFLWKKGVARYEAFGN